MDGPTNSTDNIEFVFLGTGTSSSLPQINCLTAPPDAKTCRACTSTLNPDGKKNIRRNTSAAIRMNTKDGRKVTIIIDVGKNFLASALEWFPKYGLRKIDAVLITHAHADAMNGLDDLRGWTLRSKIQPHIDIYMTQATFVEAKRSFPYLISKEFATGGGDVPLFLDFKWHIIEDKVPFEIENTGIWVTPFLVHHGRLFTKGQTGSLPEGCPTPNSIVPSSLPVFSRVPTPEPVSDLLSASKHPAGIHPYLCLGFNISDTIIYMSDVSYITTDIWTSILDPLKGKIPIFVVDCLYLEPHISHLGVGDAIAAARRMEAKRTYLTGFGHEVSHDEFVTMGECVGGKKMVDETEQTEVVKEGLKLIGEGLEIWVRPSHDGLRAWISADGGVRDETYG